MTSPMSGERAFLLVEAALTSVVLTVGAVSMSRGLGQMVQHLARLQRQDELMMTAAGILRALEQEALAEGRTTRQSGTGGSGNEAYQWAVRYGPAPDAWPAQETWHRVELTVRRNDSPRLQTMLTTCWPRAWVEE